MKASNWIYIIALAGLCVAPTQAGYRSVEQKDEKKSADHAVAKKQSRPSVQCRKKNGAKLDMGRGFAQATLQRNEEVELSWTKPGLTPNDSVFAYTVHGGRINGEITTTLKPDDTGTVTFRFKIGPWPGNYPIIFRCAGREEVVEFWVESSSQSGGAQ